MGCWSSRFALNEGRRPIRLLSSGAAKASTSAAPAAPIQASVGVQIVVDFMAASMLRAVFHTERGASLQPCKDPGSIVGGSNAGVGPAARGARRGRGGQA